MTFFILFISNFTAGHEPAFKDPRLEFKVVAVVSPSYIRTSLTLQYLHEYAAPRCVESRSIGCLIEQATLLNSMFTANYPLLVIYASKDKQELQYCLSRNASVAAAREWNSSCRPHAVQVHVEMVSVDINHVNKRSHLSLFSNVRWQIGHRDEAYGYNIGTITLIHDRRAIVK